MQAALTRDIRETMRAWRQQLQECALVFVHAPAANAGPLFQGEAPPLSRGDRRVRAVPFTTRRPTFSETKRVAQLLLTASAAEPPKAAAPPPAGVISTAATSIIACQEQEMCCMHASIRQPGGAVPFTMRRPCLLRDHVSGAAAAPCATSRATQGTCFIIWRLAEHTWCS